MARRVEFDRINRLTPEEREELNRKIQKSASVQQIERAPSSKEPIASKESPAPQTQSSFQSRASGAAAALNAARSSDSGGTGADVIGGAASMGLAGASVGGPVGAGVGAALGAGIGILKAREAKKKEAQRIKEQKIRQEIAIEDQKTQRISSALDGLRQSLAASLLRQQPQIRI